MYKFDVQVTEPQTSSLTIFCQFEISVV